MEDTVTAEEVRALAETLAADVPGIGRGMFEFLATRIAEVDLDEETRALTLASCVANIEAGLLMLRHGIPAERAEAPVAALEHARHMAARRGSTDATLRFYRLGHAYFWQLWVAALGETVDDPQRLARILRETSAFTFTYVDAISSRVSVELLAERDRRERFMAAQREDVASAILAGGTVDLAAAERTLGFVFERRHVALICWTEGAPSDLQPAATRLADALGAPRPLLIAHGGTELAGWIHVDADDRLVASRLGAAAATLGPEVRVAVGAPASGVEGFRGGHDQARRAQRVAQLAGTAGPAVTHFDDVRYVDLLARDLDAARAFVAAELGGLAGPDARSGQLREFLLAYLATDGNATATAAALGLHRNTARQRLARAEELRGVPVTRHRRELHAALVLAGTLGEAVLPDA